MAALHVCLLGDFKLEQNGELITTVKRARLQSLLAYLLLHSHAPQPRRAVAFQLWPDSSEEQAHNNLRKALHQLRGALAQINADGAPGRNRWLQIDAQTLQWRPDSACTVDVHEFELKLRQAHDLAPHDSTALQHLLEEAVALYQGDLLPSCYDEWLTPVRERLRQAFLETLERLMWLAEDQRDYATAIHHAHHLLQHDPLHEATYRRLMHLYMADGNRASALNTYHTCAALLQRELGVEPGLEIRQAYAQLLALATPAVSHVQPTSATADMLRLVGRQPEWQTLRKAWWAALRGQPHFCLIRGEAGLGKTRLAEELLTWVSRQGGVVAQTRSYAAEGALAYAPVVEWLRSPQLQPTWQALARVWLSELARLLPELLTEYPDLPPPGPLTERWQRNRLFEALARALLATLQKPGFSEKPGLLQSGLLLVLDDLQWCDGETLEWLHFLLHYNPQARLLVVGTVRPEEVTADHPLTPLLLDWRHRGQISEIELEPLDRAETAALAAQVAEQPLSDQAIAQLYQLTEGNPLFIVETLRANRWPADQDGDQQSASQDVMRSPLPPKVYAMIQQRLAQLSPAGHELVCLAAVIGRSFTFPLLAQASGLAENDLGRGLDDLWQRRLVRTSANESYDFAHDRIREVAYTETSPIQRRLLHRRVAQAMEVLFTDKTDDLCGQLGLHYAEAQQWPAALHYYRQAAQVSADISALDRVLFYAEKVLAILDRLPNTQEHAEWRIDSWLAIAKALIGVEGLTAAKRQAVLDLAYQWTTAIKDRRRQLQVLSDLYGYTINCGDYYRAYHLATESIEVAQQLADKPLLPAAYNLLGSAALHRGELPAALEHFRQGMALENVLAADQQQAIKLRIVNLPSMMAETLWLCGYPEQAHTLGVAGIQVADEQAAPHGRVHSRELLLYTAQRAGDKVTMQRLANEIMELCAKFSYPDYALSAQVFLGWLMAETGSAARGVTQIEEVFARMAQMNMHFKMPYFLYLLAQAQHSGGQLAQAQQTLERALAITQTSGDVQWQAELLRLTGELHRQAGAADRNVECLYETALTVARQQQAKMLELRATVSLARLWQNQGRRTEAHQILAAIYGWFSEGFETADLQAAHALLAELA